MAKVRLIKAKIGNQVLDILHECNMAGVDSGYDEGVNDLPLQSSRQPGTFGHIAEALKSLGYGAEYDQYCMTGDRPKIKAPV